MLPAENEGPFQDLPDNNFGFRNRSMTFHYQPQTLQFDLMIKDPKSIAGQHSRQGGELNH